MHGKMQLVRKMQILVTTSTLTACRIFWTLVIPVHSSHNALTVLLNAPDGGQKRNLTRAWHKNKLADLKRIGITAALVAGVISSTFSWTTIAVPGWKAKAAWYSGLVLALTSISTAGLHINALLRMSWTPDWECRLQTTLGRPVHSGVENLTGGEAAGAGARARWRPRTFQPWIWQAPDLMLKVSIYLLIAGLAIAIWEDAVSVGMRWGSEELKIAIVFTTFGAFALANYALLVYCLAVPTLDSRSTEIMTAKV